MYLFKCHFEQLHCNNIIIWLALENFADKNRKTDKKNKEKLTFMTMSFLSLRSAFVTINVYNKSKLKSLID